LEGTSLKQLAMKHGAHVVGIADLDKMRQIPTIPENLLDGYNRAVSMGVAVSSGVFETIDGAPTKLYLQQYLTVNNFLDHLALKVAAAIEDMGGRAMAIPASEISDPENYCGNISHKAVARMAGIGWQGKNLLIVNPDYGSRLRLVTVLTDLELEPDKPIKNRCGQCSNCADTCPAGAIKNVDVKDYPESRDEVLHFQRCVEKLTKDFAEGLGLGKPICGICIKVCPWSKPRYRHKAGV